MGESTAIYVLHNLMADQKPFDNEAIHQIIYDTSILILYRYLVIPNYDIEHQGILGSFFKSISIMVFQKFIKREGLKIDTSNMIDIFLNTGIIYGVNNYLLDLLE